MKKEEKQNSSKDILEIRRKLKEKRQLVARIDKDVGELKDQLCDFTNWGFTSKQKKIQIKNQIVVSSFSYENQVKNNLKNKRTWENAYTKNKVSCKILPSNIFYPPSCSGYDMVYCKALETIYVYGGISCSSNLHEGIKPHFYKYTNGKWSQVKPESAYNPMPRYGHTLTIFQKDLILFGGVSEYKEKLKDRCFYTDCSAYNTTKNNWKVIESTGQHIKTRKNHSACMYLKHFIVYGGLDQSDQTIEEISWVNLDCKKPRWKNLTIEGRFNHKMTAVMTQSNRDFLCVFGGRNSSSDIVNTFFIFPLNITEGQLNIKDFTVINHSISPRQMPIFTEFMQGIIITGGINQNSEVVEDTWYYNAEKQSIEEIHLNINFSELRGAKGASIKGEKVYVLAGNSLTYKAIMLECDK